MATTRLNRWSQYKLKNTEALKCSKMVPAPPAGALTGGAAALAKELGIELPNAAA